MWKPLFTAYLWICCMTSSEAYHSETIRGTVIFTSPADMRQEPCQHPYPGTSQCWPCVAWNLRNHNLTDTCNERIPRLQINAPFEYSRLDNRIFRSEIAPCLLKPEDGTYECRVDLTHNEKTASVDLTLTSDGEISGFVNLQNEVRRGRRFSMAYLRHGFATYDGDSKSFEVTVSCPIEEDVPTPSCNIRDVKLLVVKYRCV